ncbi:MAG TPA: prepilin-type N-terminal cleavage/methylation domain-containing protein [Candidatus Methylacidiphilales bacterium]
MKRATLQTVFFGKVPHHRDAFTLVELMVSVAVFTLMIGMLSGMVSMTATAIHLNHEEMDAADNSRKILDALATDLDYRSDANGVSVLVSQDTNQNTTLAFLTQSRGPSDVPGTRYMAISYQLNGHNLTRSATPITWGTAQLGAATAATTTSGTASVLASTGLRFQAVLLLDNGTTLPLPASAPATEQSWETTTVNGETLPTGFYNLVLSTSPADPNNPRVSGIIVAVATLDGQSIKLGNAGQMGTSFSSPTGTQTAVDAWQANLAAITLTHAYPKPALSALNLGQQTYTLK